MASSSSTLAAPPSSPPSDSPSTTTPQPVPTADETPTLHSTPASEPAQTPRNPSRIITLIVGEQIFTTRASTLTTTSPYFRNLLSHRIPQFTTTTPPLPLDPHTYFLDADPTAFSHLLRHLRTGLMPLLWTPSSGFDYNMYAALQHTARQFGVAGLEAWIAGQQYRRVVRGEWEVQVGEEGVVPMRERGEAGVEVQVVPWWRVRKVYVCPRGVRVHEGEPGKCGALCERARGGGERVFEERAVLTLVVVRKRIVVELEGLRSRVGGL